MKRLFVIILLLVVISGAQEIRRPTADANNNTVGFGCIASYQTSPSMPLAYDGGSSSAATGEATNAYFGQNGSTIGNQDLQKARLFSGFPAASGSYTALSLKIRHDCSVTFNNTGGMCSIGYSLNNGSTWSTQGVGNGSNGTGFTETIVLSPAQNLTQLLVGLCVEGDYDDAAPGAASMDVFDIRTEGTLGANKRRVVIVR